MDTHLQLRAFERAVSFIPRLKDCKILRRNIRLGDSILDYLLECGGKALFLEVKSAVLRIGNHAVYPDCPSSRAKRQLKDIIRAVEQGYKAMILFIAAVPNVEAFKLNRRIDEDLCELLLEAKDRGVDFTAIAMIYDLASSCICLSDPELAVEL